MILKIVDGKMNGKEDCIHVDYECFVYECSIQDKKFFLRNTHFPLNSITAILFSFNEALITYNLRWNSILQQHYSTADEMVHHFNTIATYFVQFHKHICLYNNPLFIFPLRSKIYTYNLLQTIENKIVKLPKYVNGTLTKANLSNVDFLPAIIKMDCGSHTCGDVVCHTQEELIHQYNTNFTNKTNVICIEYKNSLVKHLNKHISVRLMIYNDLIYDYYARPSTNWNIHTNDQDIGSMSVMDSYFHEYYKVNKTEIQRFFKEVHQKIGNGFYANDLVLSNGILYLCEIGLKFYDKTYVDFVHQNNITLHSKPSLSSDCINNLFYSDVVQKKPEIIVWAEGGLGNRLRPLLSTLSIVKNNRKYTSRIVWRDTRVCKIKLQSILKIDGKMECDYSIIVFDNYSLLCNPNTVEQKVTCGIAGSIQSFDLRNIANCTNNNTNIIVLTPFWLNHPDCNRRDFPSLFRSLILDKHYSLFLYWKNRLNLDNTVIGCHLRGTDLLDMNKAKQIINMIKKDDNTNHRYFVCSDMESLESEFSDCKHVMTFPKQSYVKENTENKGWVRNCLRDSESVEEGLIDMCLLSVCCTEDNRYHTYPNSTFLDVARSICGFERFQVF